MINEILNNIFRALPNVILVYFILINTFYFLFIILSLFGIRHYRNITSFINLRDIFRSPLTRGISIITPAFNEEKNIVASVKTMLSVEYPKFEVIVVNDGSTDHTLKRLIDAFNLKKTEWVFRKQIETKPVKDIYASSDFPRLVVVDKINGMKADALNAGLNISRYPLACIIDSDSIIERDAILKVARPFFEDPEKVMAAGGIVRIINGCVVKDDQVRNVRMPRSIIPRIQVVEYLRAFLGGRLGLSMLRSIMIISGAFGIYRKDIILKCGGFRKDTIVEDMDIIVRMQKYLREKKVPYKISFVPDPVCWTETPETFRSLGNQRNRWYRGLIEVLASNFNMFLNPRYGIIGMFAMPFYIVFELFGPLIEFIGYIIFAVYIVSLKIDYTYPLMFFLLAVIYGTFLSLMTILLEELSFRRYKSLSDIVSLAIAAFLENIIYRQFLTAVRAKAFLDFLLGKKEWGKMRKVGFSKD